MIGVFTPLVLAAALSGCGVLPPVNGDLARTASATTAGSQTAGRSARTETNEVPTPAGPKEKVAGAGARTPQLALREFATTYINWSASNVAARLRALARESVGQARSELQLAAAEVTVDSQLKDGGIGNRGNVEAVASLSGATNRYVVVTREQTLATNSATYSGLAPGWHLTVATVERAPTASGNTRWVVSGWQPES